MHIWWTVCKRSALVLALIATVLLVLYFTPMPAQYPQSCSRRCHELDWPMICRIRLTLERFQTLGTPCKDCPGNKSSCYLNGCITADGEPRGLLTVNRQFPGPSIEVCQFDIVLVDVVNRIPGQSFGVHWRGQSQHETPYMDGAPMITQCPIPSLTTYQYKFRASDSGTHVWQVNTGDELIDTLFGPLIVRTPDSKEMHRNLYDTDDISNVVVISNWNPQKANFLFEDKTSKTKLLINGKTPENGVPPSVFKVTPGNRHRFRVIYTGGTTNCQIRISIEHHKFLVIAMDGRPIKPKTVTSARLFPGERLDLVLKAEQKIASYSLRATPIECPTLAPTSALVQYEGIDKTGSDAYENESSNKASTLTEAVKSDEGMCPPIESNDFASVCLDDVRGLRPIPSYLSAEEPDLQLYFFYNSASVFNSEILNESARGNRDAFKIPEVNNITMMLPSSPLISQIQQISPDALCNGDFVPDRCQSNDERVCECAHVVNIPLNANVELVLVNQDDSNHVFHLHGYSFRVVGSTELSSPDLTPEAIKAMDRNGKLIRRNFDHPVEKDTIAVIAKSLVAIRFKANNPGYWLLDEERSSHWFRGMSSVLKVGKESDFPPVPENFPKCGDWVGPEFFLA